MQVSTANYFDTVQRIDVDKLPADLHDGHRFVTDTFNTGQQKFGDGWYYYNDPGISEVIDNYFSMLSEYLDKESPKADTAQEESTSRSRAEKPQETQSSEPHDDIETANPLYSEEQTVYERKSGKKVVVKKVEVSIRPNTKEHYFVYLLHDEFGNFYRGQVPEKELTNVEARPRKIHDGGVKTEQAVEPSQQTARKKQPSSPPKYQARLKPKGRTSQSPPGGKTPPANDPKVPGGAVEMISPEVAFIREWALMNGKEKTIDKIASLLKRLQMAIVEKRIRKNSPHAKDVTEMQKMAIKLHKQMEQRPRKSFTVEIPPAWHNKFLHVAGLQYMMPTIQFIKAYLRLMGKLVTREKVVNLYNRIKKAAETKKFTKEDPYIQQIMQVVNSLHVFAKTKKRTGILEIHPAQLNGLQGVVDGCQCHSLEGFERNEDEDEDEDVMTETEEDQYEEEDEEDTNEYEDDDDRTPKTMSAEQARKRHYEVLPFNDARFDFLGKMTRKFTMMIHGLPGAGKTTFLLLFAEFLATIFGPVLYVTPEEYDSPTLTMMLDRLNINVPNNLQFVERIEDDDPGKYDFIIMDSVNDHDMSYKEFRALKKKYKRQCFINVFQTTKGEDFRGVQKWKHKTDLACVVENGKIEVTKSRFGSLGNIGQVPGYKDQSQIAIP